MERQVKLSDLIFLTLVIVLAISLASIWFYPSMQEFMEGNTMWNGIRDFSRESGASNIDALEDLPDSTENVVLVAIPYMDYRPDDLEKLKRFVNDGGTIIVMDDFGFGNQLLASLDIPMRFDHRVLLDPIFCYKNQYLPLITEFSSEVREFGITSLVFNHASVLNSVDKEDALAWSSSASFLDVNNNSVLDIDEPQGPFVVAAGKKVNRGMVQIVSDTSLIINSMVVKNDNHRFVNYLTSSKGQPENLLLDRSHLTKSPLDVSRIKVNTARAFFSNPFTLVGILAVIFVIITRYTFYTFKKGENH
jgi:hypothetical protein